MDFHQAKERMQVLRAEAEALNRGWHGNSLLIASAVLLVAYTISRVFGVDPAGLAIAMLGLALNFSVALFWFLHTRRVYRSKWIRFEDNAEIQTHLAAVALAHQFTSVLFVFCFGYLIYLGAGIGPEGNRHQVSQAEEFATGSGFPAGNQSPPALEISGLQQSIKQLGETVANLTASLRSGAAVSRAGSTNSPDAQDLAGELSLSVPGWVSVTLFSLCGASFLALVGLLSTHSLNQTWGKATAISLITTIGLTGSLGFTLIGKLDIKSLFHCDNCALVARRGTQGALRPLDASPGFDVGSFAIGERTRGCVDADIAKVAWRDWLAARARDWIRRPSASASDTLLIIGSADRQALRGPLASRFDSNAGLARARADAVKHALMDAINRESGNALHRLSDSRVLVLSEGPAHTPELHRGGPGGAACDPLLAEDRRIQVWISAGAAN